MQPHTHNGADQARTNVEAAFKHAGLTPEQAHTVMDALDEYVAAIAGPGRSSPAPRPARHK